jgi:benzoylformate decarboxylase
MASRSVTGSSAIGDVSLALEQLVPLVTQKDRKINPRKTPEKTHRTIPPTSQYVESQLDEAIPTNAIVFHEAPTSERFSRIDITLPKSHFITASGGLGFAMPAAVGASIAQTERPVIAIVGDGSAQYSIQSIWSAANYKAPVTFIVLNNKEYAILKSFGMLLHEEGLPGLDVPGIDFEGLAKGYGVGFARILDPDQIASGVSSAIKSGKSSLIEIPIDPHVSPLM